MKVPVVSEEDLESEHEFKNTQGQAMMAKFVEADDAEVTLVMPKRSKTPFTLAWTSFDEKSVAQLEALAERKRKSILGNRKSSPPRESDWPITQAVNTRVSIRYSKMSSMRWAFQVLAPGCAFVKQDEVENGVPAGPLES